MQNSPKMIPAGQRIQAHAIPRPLRKISQRPRGGTMNNGTPMSNACHETFFLSSGVSSSGVPRIAATILTELTIIDAITTVMNVSTMPRQ